MYGKSNMEIYITICKTDTQWKFAVCLRKIKQGLCINLEEWVGTGDGRRVQKGGVHSDEAMTARMIHTHVPCSSPLGTG